MYLVGKKYMGSLQRELQCFRLDKYTLCCSISLHSKLVKSLWKAPRFLHLANHIFHFAKAEAALKPYYTKKSWL